ncbi:lysosomal amino acid transporter 1 homolog [Centrocercus urophasianus]|uniref:lysosomal amino acid transporter 1 homolog n=1 Tax=Centrocercus urophasianus TaxID=9002 RepID=UPI001C648BDF|nr:lysosomal amino acid transporter 1 homolog [Centrocercus urophasianus]
MAGDVTNLIGCYLTNQLPIQTITAISYVNMDIILISQFAYCKLKNWKMMKGSRRLKNFCITWILMCITLCVVLPCQLLIRKQDQSSAMERSINSLDMIEMSGFVCGYISCVFYLGSRFPQLYKNFQRKSTEGTSYLLFALAMLGNITYGLSLVLKMPAAGSVRALYFLHHLPWLLGSFGVLFLDFFVTVQFLLYGQHKERSHALVALEVEPLLVGEEDA